MLMWVHSIVTHLCWRWLKFINGGHPTPDISWISVLPGNPSNLSFCIFFLDLFIIFLSFLHLYLALKVSTSERLTSVITSTLQRNPPPHTLWHPSCVHMAIVGGNPWLVTKIHNTSFLMQARMPACAHKPHPHTCLSMCTLAQKRVHGLCFSR